MVVHASTSSMVRDNLEEILGKYRRLSKNLKHDSTMIDAGRLPKYDEGFFFLCSVSTAEL